MIGLTVGIGLVLVVIALAIVAIVGMLIFGRRRP